MCLMVAAVAGALYNFLSVDRLALIGVVYVAFQLGDLLTKLVFNLLPRSLNGDSSGKAVLITGKSVSHQLFN